MTDLVQFMDRILACRTREHVDATWKAWCLQIGFPYAGTQGTQMLNNRMIMHQIDTNYDPDLVEYYLDKELFRFSQSSNPLRKTGVLEGLHFDTFSKHLDGKPAAFKEFIEFVRDIQVPGEMWVRFETGQTHNIAYSVWSTDPERQFLQQIKDVRHVLMAAASIAFVRSQNIANHADIREPASLTPRESDCLLWIARGDRQQEISDRLRIDIKTVELHLRNARSKIAARTTAEAVAKAVLSGLIAP